MRPARFRDGPGTGLVHLAAHTGPGEIDRPDAAAVLAHLLTVPATTPRLLELVHGPTPVHQAVTHVAARSLTDHRPRPSGPYRRGLGQVRGAHSLFAPSARDITPGACRGRPRREPARLAATSPPRPSPPTRTPVTASTAPSAPPVTRRPVRP
ncbi:hypothetical protein [Kitasatospora sp. NPDC057738]|uniref:hypothetical protein n=1 Tax=Kitasatospora sp. NPDC057738 TaxID=3346233 RepID=UPI00367A6A4E